MLTEFNQLSVTISDDDDDGDNLQIYEAQI